MFTGYRPVEEFPSKAINDTTRKSMLTVSVWNCFLFFQLSSHASMQPRLCHAFAVQKFSLSWCSHLKPFNFFFFFWTARRLNFRTVSVKIRPVPCECSLNLLTCTYASNVQSKHHPSPLPLSAYPWRNYFAGVTWQTPAFHMITTFKRKKKEEFFIGAQER